MHLTPENAHVICEMDIRVNHIQQIMCSSNPDKTIMILSSGTEYIIKRKYELVRWWINNGCYDYPETWDTWDWEAIRDKA